MSKQDNDQLYYKKVEDLDLEIFKNRIRNVLKEAFDNKIITEEELKAMDPSDKNPAKFYCNFKIHKPHIPTSTPPVRPIISGSGSITENIGIYVENVIKEMSMQHRSYLQDTPHLLRIIHKINKGPKIPDNAMIVTSDVIGLYQTRRGRPR